MAQRGKKKGAMLREGENGGGRMMCRAQQSRARSRRGAGCLSAIQPVSYSVTRLIHWVGGIAVARQYRSSSYLFCSGELCRLSTVNFHLQVGIW